MYVHRNWNKLLFAAVAVVAAGAGGFIVFQTAGHALGEEQVTPIPNRSDAKTAEDEKAIQKRQEGYVNAFNAGDAKALSSFWATDGEFVDADGKSFRSRSVIAKEFASFFAESKGLKLEISTDSLRFVGPNVALESGVSRVIRASDGVVNVTNYHIVHAKRDGQWQLESVRESTHTPSSNYEMLRGLEWLVGNWAAKNGGQTLELSCEWTAKRNFILRKYALKNDDGTNKTGIQIIGWDPVAGGIRSWIFDSDGGFGSERWTRDGRRWVLEATGVTRDGAQVAATNILTPIDHDNFSWQSVRRVLNHVRLPDTEPIKATRVKSKN